MIPDCDGRSDGRSDGQTESIMAKTALCIASYADALSKREPSMRHLIASPKSTTKRALPLQLLNLLYPLGF